MAKLSDLQAITTMASDDILHLKPTTGNDLKITWANLVKAIQLDLEPVGTIKIFDANRPTGGGSPGGASGAWVDNSTIPNYYACIAANSVHGCENLTDKFIMGKVVAGAGTTAGANAMTITSAMLPTHTHAIDHDHPVKTSSTPSANNTGINGTSHHHNHTHGDIASGIQSASHTHTTNIGSHGHNLATLYNPSAGSSNYAITPLHGVGTNHGTPTWQGNASYYRADSTTIGNKTSGIQSASHTHTTTIPQKTSDVESDSHSHPPGSHTHTVNLDNFIGSSGNGGFANTAFNNRPAYYTTIFIRKCA